jgi:hypothetical protein
MKVNGKLYALGKTKYHLCGGLGGQFGKEKLFLCWEQNPCSSVIQPVAQPHPVISVEELFRNSDICGRVI